MVSPDGGVEIEKVAAETPERIFKVAIHPALGLQPFQARALAFQPRPDRRPDRQGGAA